jgi:hypothetical protein
MNPTLRWAVQGVLVLACMTAAGRAHGESTSNDDNFLPDVMWCEEAVERLVDCCPGFDPRRLSCRHSHHFSSGGCGSGSERSDVWPALSAEESSCVKATSCTTLIERDVCGRAQEALAYTAKRSTSAGGTTEESKQTHAPVCP